jgi:hypothetical protein
MNEVQENNLKRYVVILAVLCARVPNLVYYLLGLEYKLYLCKTVTSHFLRRT